MTTADADGLRIRLADVERAVQAAVAVRRGGDPGPDDGFRGLYLTDQQVDTLLSGPTPALPAAGGAEAAGRLGRLGDAFGLTEAELTVLVVALAPDLDPRFEKFYGYLHDDVTRRRATVGLALELAGLSTWCPRARRLVAPDGALVHNGLVVVEEPDRPALGRALRVPDRVLSYLLGADDPDPALVPLLGDIRPVPLAPALPVVAGLVYLREAVAGGGLAAAVSARPDAVCVGWERFPAGADLAELAQIAGREAKLRGVSLVAGPVEAIADPAVTIRLWADLDVDVVLTGMAPWQPAWSRRSPLMVDVPNLTEGERAALWRDSLRGVRLAADVDLASLTAPYRFSPGQIAHAGAAARVTADLDGGVVTASGLRSAARGSAAAGLERLARRVPAGVGWADLVLPTATLVPLRELAARVRHRDHVLADRAVGGWGMRPGGGRGTGVTGLFAGDSGTGKTMAAEVVAGELGLDLYVVDLSTVVDKYVGETEKNLSRIFDQAERCSAVLLFDEADALFAKRGEVAAAHDRYANVETAYLLQRMESFDGVALLTTNLRANLDEAFLRRLDVIVDFPKPDEADRLRLWQACLSGGVPVAGDLDLAFCARSFELSGGGIRAAAVTAAYLAAEAGRAVTMADLVTAVHREYRKLGRLALAHEFGDWVAAGGR